MQYRILIGTRIIFNISIRSRNIPVVRRMIQSVTIYYNIITINVSSHQCHLFIFTQMGQKIRISIRCETKNWTRHQFLSPKNGSNWLTLWKTKFGNAITSSAHPVISKSKKMNDFDMSHMRQYSRKWSSKYCWSTFFEKRFLISNTLGQIESRCLEMFSSSHSGCVYCSIKIHRRTEDFPKTLSDRAGACYNHFELSSHFNCSWENQIPMGTAIFDEAPWLKFNFHLN